MGAVFSQLIRGKLSTDNQFSGRLKLCRPCCRSAGPWVLLSPGGMVSPWTDWRSASFAAPQMDGMRSCRWEARFIAFVYMNLRPGAHYLPSSCRSTPISTFACRRLIDFGRHSNSALSGLPFLRYLSCAGAGSYSPYARWMHGRREIPTAKSQQACSGNTGFPTEPGKLTICAAVPSVWSRAD
jgi:hypothetical protein